MRESNCSTLAESDTPSPVIQRKNICAKVIAVTISTIGSVSERLMRSAVAVGGGED
jgi:hypothetical protein